MLKGNAQNIVNALEEVYFQLTGERYDPNDGPKVEIKLISLNDLKASKRSKRKGKRNG